VFAFSQQESQVMYSTMTFPTNFVHI